MSEISDLYEAYTGAQRQQARATATTALEDNPDEAARAQQLSLETGVPASVIHGDLEDFEHNYKAQLNSDLIAKSPILQDYINHDPMAAKVSHDDFPQLNAVAEATKAVGGAGLEGFKTGFDFQGFLDEYNKARNYIDNPTWREFMQGPGGAMLVAPSLGARVFSGILQGGPQALGEAFYQMSGSRAWADRLTRDLYVLGQTAMIEPGAPLIGRAPGELTAVAREAKALPEPPDATKIDAGLQKLNDAMKAAEPWLQNGELPPRGVHEVFDEAWKDASKEDLKSLDDALSEATKSKTRQRSPELFGNLVKQIVGNGKIEIDAEAVRKLYGDNVPTPDDGKLGWVPNLKEQLDAAEATGGSVEVPLADWLARVEPELAKELRDDIRVRPQGFTNNEIEVFDKQQEAKAKEREEKFEPEGGSPPKDEVEAVRRVAGVEEPLFSAGWESVDTRPGEYTYRSLLPENAERGGEIPHSTEGGKPVPRVVGTTLGELLDRVNWKDQDEATRMLSEFYGSRLKELVGDTPVHIVTEENMPKLMREGDKRNPPGYYSPLHDHIVLADYLVNGEMPDWYSAKVIMHEGDHAVNSAALLKYPVLDAATRLVMKDADLHMASRSPKARKEFNYAFHGNSAAKEGAPYNSREFMAEVRSRPALRKWLAQAPASPETIKAVQRIADALGIKDKVVSTWDAIRIIFKDLYSKVFGRVPKDSVLDQVFKLSEILEDANANLERMAKEQGISKGELLRAGLVDRAEGDLRLIDAPERGDGHFDIREAGGKPIGIISVSELEGGKKLWINNMGAEGGKHSLGPTLVRGLLGQLKERYPNAESIGGQRITGARYDMPIEKQLTSIDFAEGEGKPLFGKMAIGMNKRWQEKYFKLIEKKNAEDMERQFKVAEREERQRQTEQWKRDAGAMYQEVRDDFQGRPDIAIGSFFNEGLLHGVKVPEQYTKLDSAKLTAEQKAMLPKVTYRRGGVDPDDLASAFGLRSGDEVVQVLAQINAAKGDMPFRQYVDTLLRKEVSRRMLGRFGDLEENIMNEAIEHVLSQTQLDLLHEEMVGLAERLGQKLPLTKEDTVAQAKLRFSETPIGQITVEKMLRDAGKSGTDAELALLDNEPDEALQAKGKQHLSLVMAKEAAKLEKQQRQFARTMKSASRRVIPGVDPEYTDFVHEIMIKIGEFSPGIRSLQDIERAKELNQNTTLEAFVQKKASESFGLRQLPIADFLFDPNYKNTVDKMTVDEFRAVKQSIDTLIHNGKDEGKINGEGISGDRAKVIAEMKEKLKTFPLKDYPGTKGMLARALDLPKSFLAASTSMETVLRRWARQDPFDIFHRYIIYPLAEAANGKDKLIREFSKIYQEAFGKVKDGDKLMDSPFNDPLKRTDEFPEGQPWTGFTRKNGMMILQNMGNVQNWNVLVKGFSKALGVEIDSAALRQWVFDNFKREDFDRAQRIGDMFSKAFDLVETVDHNINGVAPERISLQSFETPYGTYRGWYHPLIRDPLREVSGRERGSVWDDDFYGHVSLANSFTKRRTGAVYPLSLEWDMVPIRLQQMLHYVSFREAILNAEKVFSDKGFKSAVTAYYGEHYSDGLLPYLKGVAGAESIDSRGAALASRVSNFLRANVIHAYVGFNPYTALKHGPTALVLSMRQVGPINFMKAFASLNSKSPEIGLSNRQWVDKTFEEVSRRARHWEETISGQHRDLLGAGTTRDKIMEAGSWLVAQSDMVSTRATALAAYWKAMEEIEVRDGEPNHGLAVAAANQAVRLAHGSTAVTNLPALVRGGGPLHSWLTTLYGFFGTMMQRRIELFHEMNDIYHLGKDGEIGEAAKRLPSLMANFFTYVIWPTVVEEYVTSLTTDDRRGWGAHLVSGTFLGLASSVLYIRDLVHSFVTGHDPGVGLISSPLHDISNLYHDAALGKKAINKEHIGKLVGDALTVFGEATGRFARTPAEAVRFGIDVQTGQQRPRTFTDWRMGLTRGTIKKRVQR